MTDARPVIIAYVPVVHAGYLKFLRSHPTASVLYLFDYQLTAAAQYLYKDIRALTLDEVRQTLSALDIPQTEISILTPEIISELAQNHTPIIIPAEDVTQALVAEVLPDNPVTEESIFLRWHRKNSVAKKDVAPDVTVSTDERDRRFIDQALAESLKSEDFWRGVGAVLIATDGTIITAHNHHLPNQHCLYINGSPRGCFSRGVELDKSSAIHAEQAVIGAAAKSGVSLEGASLYVSTFPCPSCAKLVAASGVKKLYFASGYTVVDGADVLRAAGVEIAHVAS